MWQVQALRGARGNVSSVSFSHVCHVRALRECENQYLNLAFESVTSPYMSSLLTFRPDAASCAILKLTYNYHEEREWFVRRKKNKLKEGKEGTQMFTYRYRTRFIRGRYTSLKRHLNKTEHKSRKYPQLQISEDN